MKSAPDPHLPAQPGLYRVRCAGVADPQRPLAGAAEILLDLGPADPTGLRSIVILAVGRPAEVSAHEAAPRAAAVDLGARVLLPGLVNAHTHLDLTHIGPQPHAPAEGFVAWVERIRAGRAHDAAGIAAAVRRGVELSLRAGVVLVGDIAGAPAGRPSLAPFHALAHSPLRAVSFLEFFAIGLRESAALDRLERTLADLPAERTGPVRPGLQPHAPNTVARGAYHRAVQLAAALDLALCTHLAETPEEREFVARATGPQREMLERFALWSDALLDDFGLGRSPIEHLAPVLDEAPFLLAHVNDLGPAPDAALRTLASSGASVAYCPRASAYFDAPAHFGPHRYRDMLDAGVNVCLGTDSIVNLPRGVDSPDGPGLSVLDEARLLFRRDAADPEALLAMATVNGARALGFDESGFRLADGARPFGIVAVEVLESEDGGDPWELALSSAAPAKPLALGNNH